MIMNPVTHLSDGVITKDEVLIQTDLEDIFMVKYETRNFPKLITTVEIYDTNLNKLGRYHLRDYFEVPRFPVLLDKPNLRIYQIVDGIIYKANEGRFKGIQYWRLKKADFIENPELIEVARSLIETKEWLWLRNIGKFLVMLGDDEVKSVFQRYSLGDFIQEELEVNQNSEITKKQMLIFAQKVLKEYKSCETESID